ncbi:uncharacterized protein LOC142829153 [Pelodiscus sinensis]|uniref:uncharacterized protein LOC142829153 n=1 Tax=Pelodiscus sinensis TaxID=13735 RepID=UPI003F6ACAFD
MAEFLANRGHHPCTEDQVHSKVQELCQGYIKAREENSRSGAAPHSCPYYSELSQILGGGEARTPLRLVQSDMGDPMMEAPEQDLQQSRESGGGEMVPEDEDSEEMVTLILEPVTQIPEASQVLSDAGDEAAAGPAVQEGRSTPAPPPSWGHGSRRHRCVYADILRHHVAAMQELNTILQERTEAEARWHDRLMEELVQQCTSLCATLREVCGLPAPVPGPAPPAPHDPAPPNTPSTAPSLSPLVPPSPPAPPMPQTLTPLSPWPSSPPGLPDPSAPTLCCSANRQSPHPIPRPWCTPNTRHQQETASKQAPCNLIPFPSPGFKHPHIRSRFQVPSPPPGFKHPHHPS